MPQYHVHQDSTKLVDIQNLLVSEYFTMNCAHSCTTWAISASTSFVAFILDRDVFSRMLVGLFDSGNEIPNRRIEVRLR